MSPEMTPDQLREVFLSIATPESARLLAVSLSAVLVVTVLWLVHRGRLREEYTPIWMGVALAMVVVSIRLDWLQGLTRAVGAWAPSSVIFFLGEVFLLVICLNYAVRLSQAAGQIKNLAQELALLRAKVERLDTR